ncbi:MAG: IclR family transcriptional regulator [Solirubrobacteraceae bacterium]
MPAGALERAVQLLGSLSDRTSELTVAELASDAGMPTSTAYRLLAELEQHGFVQRGPDRTVALGTRLVALGRSAEAGLGERIVGPAGPVMIALSAAVGETVILTAPCALEAIVLHVVETELHSVRLSYARFRRGPLDRGASAKVLAAFLEDAERERLLLAAGDDAPSRASALAQIRRDGYAFTVSELDPGAAAVAAPILDRRGRLVAGLSIAGPEERITRDVPAITAAVREAAGTIERAQSA